MAVPAIELRPRGALQLFDAAIRLSARSSGVWSITLPAGALVTGALLQFVEATRHVRPLLVPTLLLTAAWLFRAIAQGAACHHLEAELLSENPSSVRASYKAAFKRAPSLFITSAFNFFFNLITLPLTLGLSLLFLSSHIVGYAVAMQGKGHPLAIYGTASQMLGKARGNTSWVRTLFFTQALVILNLHIATTFLIYIGRKLFGMDLTFADRYVSMDNAVWVSAIVAIGFTLFEPLRAATATLLLIDGRVRQEGLDLLAVIEQLPRKRSKPPAVPVAPIVALLLLLTSGAARAEAKSSPAELRARIWAAANHCGLKGEEFREQIAAVEVVAKKDPNWIGGLAEEVEALSEADECERVVRRLDEELLLVLQRRDTLLMGELDALAHGELSTQQKDERPPPEGSALRARFWAVANHCGMQGTKFRTQLDAVERLAATNHNALTRSLQKVERLANEEDDCEAALAELKKDLEWIEMTQAAAVKLEAADAQKKAKEILARPEFLPDGVVEKTPDEPKQEDDQAPGWWSRFLQWLKKLFEDDEPRARERTPSSFGAGGGQLLANILVVVVIAALVLALGFVILSVRARRRGAEEGDPEVASSALPDASVDPNSALARPPESWASLADQLAAQGRFREAVRSLYLALLSRLHRDGAIDYDPAKSNWEYFRGFKGRSEWLSPFKELTRRFDYAWYGNEDVTDSGYRNFRELTRPMLTAQEPQHA